MQGNPKYYQLHIIKENANEMIAQNVAYNKSICSL